MVMALDKPWVTTRPLEDSNGNPRGNARVLADITQDAGFGKAIGLTFLPTVLCSSDSFEFQRTGRRSSVSPYFSIVCAGGGRKEGGASRHPKYRAKLVW